MVNGHAVKASEGEEAPPRKELSGADQGRYRQPEAARDPVQEVLWEHPKKPILLTECTRLCTHLCTQSRKIPLLYQILGYVLGEVPFSPPSLSH